MKHPLYYLGDILTKVGCGFFGGACVSLLYNISTTDMNKVVIIEKAFFWLLFIGTFIILLGTVLIAFFDKPYGSK
ncbi:hypothetical protein COV14_01640 [Candidatus Woesearchaeota archaeon CG10_big_fil_rev_8_21_14_0_10_33_12]|nr:MAG: hypothetical protein COV14_01640 [Candidatus Woesearchaeota archaeon CG10_big_fil_rev_8_21_14_0_10_33_12]